MTSLAQSSEVPDTGRFSVFILLVQSNTGLRGVFLDYSNILNL